MRILLTSLILAVVSSLVAPVAAQETADEEIELVIPAARQGYWIGAGYGGTANLNFQTDGPDTGTLLGSGGHLRIGQMITEWFGMGLQFGGGVAENDRFDTSFGGVMLDAQLVLLDHLAIHGGVGAGGLAATDHVDEDAGLLGTGGGFYMVGASYDWFPFWDRGSGGWSLSPQAQLQYLPGNLFDAYVFLVSVDVVWWTGLEKNKLELGIDEAFQPEK
jgi:hypothetical protein